jgi:hypothetical protein
MQPRLRRIRMMVAAAALAVALPGFASSDRVIDSTTGKPIPGVYVIATWRGQAFAGVESQGVCYNVAATQTDASGEFHLPSWSGNFNPLISHRLRFYQFYKPGYRGPTDQLQTEGPFELTPDHSPPPARMRAIVNQMGAAACGTEEQRKAVVLPYFRAVYAELVDLAPHPDKAEQRLLNDTLFRVEEMEFGYGQAYRNQLKRQGVRGIE